MKVNLFKDQKTLNNFTRIFILLIGLLGHPFSITSQTNSDSIIMSAMRDELLRNLNRLHAEGLEKPFFISYTIADAENIQIVATLGALILSDEINYKDWQVRLMVGDYEVNDENFSSTQPENTIFRPSIDMPVDDDYLGIRRSLWLTTNNVYYSAAQTYKNKMAQIEHKQLDEEDLEIADFSRTPVVRKYLYSNVPEFQKEALENKVRSLSEIFKNYSKIYSSSVGLSVFRSTVYFVNSEGTEIQFPFNITTLSIQAGTISDDSERLNKNITYTVLIPDDLPSDATIEHDIRKLVDNLLTLRNSERYNDNYYGPVLIVGEIAAETFEKFLFAGSDALIASRENLQSSNQMNIFYEQNDNSLQSRIGKPILSKDLTIIARPFLKKFMDVALIGTFEVDAEGVIPPEELILVKDGMLKNLLNGRTPSRFVPESNGHMRFDYSFRGLNQQVGPGVICIENSNPVSIEKLKEHLLEQAKKEGLDYAILIRSLEVGGSDKPFNFYLVSVETGEEKLVRSVQLKDLTMQSLRRSPLFSDSSMVHNTLLPISKNASNGLAGMPSSFIIPNAILLNDVELEGTRKPLTSMLPFIENPVGKNENTISGHPPNKPQE